MSRFVNMVREHGSIIRACESAPSTNEDRDASGARYDLFRAPREGIGQLIDWIAADLASVQIKTGAAVTSVTMRVRRLGFAGCRGDHSCKRRHYCHACPRDRFIASRRRSRAIKTSR